MEAGFGDGRKEKEKRSRRGKEECGSVGFGVV